ncbi:FAD-binding protein [Bradyrhizobium sp. dw_411]|uniref:FAD-binding oxidoreductase n=1 Tax=Bradyrhizobium sp. dw_411 TaxID=2720082 RepID=UPI001BCDB0CE|nr:FAD-binding protein [Bradyrhizobium sp. dw_411]
MKRRDFLKASGGLSAQLIVGGTLLSAGQAEADTALPIAALQAQLDPKKDMVLIPVTKTSQQFDISFAKRTQLTPRVRVVASSAAAVSATILWATSNGVNFAIRSGGHSYEGFSQSPDLVIDVRGMKAIKLSGDKKSVSIGSGTQLGSVYDALASSHLAIPAGSCFPVGVAGHSLGGGFGLLGRPFGLACDSILSMEVVDATGKILTASAQENPDLFWALRGGGNGNFGVVTNFNFRASSVNMVAKFAITWTKPVTQAVKIVQAWQQWLENMPSSITGTLHLTKAKGGLITVHMAGLSVQSETSLKAELKRLQTLAGAANIVSTRTLTFHQAATIFDGGEPNPDSVLMKAKSDYVTDAMTEQGITTLLEGLVKAPGEIAVLCDTYGGAINKIAADATAFVHRGNTKYVMQYFMQWDSAGATNGNIAMMRTLYNSMRPFVSGGCYVNYCDLDLGDGYAKAYWGDNLPRLMKIKSEVDPKNIFKHAQSVPLS